MSDEMHKAFMGLRAYMFENVYTNPLAKSEEEKATYVINHLFEYYMKNIDEMSEEFVRLIENGDTKERAVCDFIACMTDQYATNIFKNLMIPKTWNVL